MQTKPLLPIAWLLALGVSCWADSYTITLQPGANLIANQLDNGGNTLDEILSALPGPATLVKYNGCGGGVTIASYDPDFGWDPSSTLAPGEGAILYYGGSAASVTFTGTPHVPVLPVTLCPGLNLLSRQTNDIATYENIVGLSPSLCSGTTVYRFNPGPGSDPNHFGPPDYTVFIFQNGAWDPRPPTVNVGEAVWIETEAPTVVINSQPASATVVACSDVTFTVTATGDGPLSYQWWFNDQPIPGATNPSYEISSAKESNAGPYTVAVSDSCSAVASDHAVLEVRSTVVITTQPASATFAVCSTPYNIRFTVAATGNGPLSYQWFFNNQPIPGANNASYEIISVNSANAGGYTVTIRDSCSSATSALALLTAGPSMNITGQPTVAACSNVTFTVTATGDGPLSYQWLFNDQPIPGATAASYEISPINSTNAGTYTASISDSCSTLTSAPARLTVNPSVIISSATVAACSNTKFTFSVTATGSGSLTYQWLLNGQPIPGATNPSYETSLASSTDAGAYTIRISDSCSTVTIRPLFVGSIYGHNAGANGVDTFDRDTGTLLQSYFFSEGNGRGIAVVGNILYTTAVGDPNIYKIDATTGSSLGSILTPIQSMATLAWDGSHLWATAYNYTGQNKAYELDIAGNLIKTITLPLADNGSASDGGSDGMEYFNGKLIVNRGDAVGVYDIYDLNGNVLVPNFINTGTASTGIAFDGQNFFISDLGEKRLSVWCGDTGAFITYIPLGSGGGPGIEDLSFDYSTRPDTSTGPDICHCDITECNDPGQCGAVVNYVAPVLSGGCMNVTTACSTPPGSFFPIGTTTVNCAATNPAGEIVAHRSFHVTVKDCERPIITCSPDIVACADPGQTSKSNLTYVVTATDNCPGVTFSCNPPSGTNFSVGTTNVSCVAIDAAGNSNRCVFAVTVNANAAAAPLSNLTRCRGDTATYMAVTSGGGALSYGWSLDGSPIGTDTPLMVVATDGLTDGNHTVQVIITGECGSVTNRATLTVQSCARGGPCALTQGFYGNVNGKSITLTSNLLSSGPLVVGKTGVRSLSIPQSAVPLLQTRMPASGTPTTLPNSGDQNLLTAVLPLYKATKFANVFLGQTITLSLNVRLDPSLPAVQLRTTFCTEGVSAGPDGSTGTADDVPVTSDVQTFTTPNSVLAALSDSGLGINDVTVRGLLELANRALAGQPTGGASVPDINSAVDAINRGFDGCRVPVDCITHAPLAPSLNDSFGNPIVLGGGWDNSRSGFAGGAKAMAANSSVTAQMLRIEGFNCEASKEAGEPDVAGNAGGKPVWWQWTATLSELVTIQTAGSSFDTLFGVYVGSSRSNLTLIASSDDTPGSLTAAVIFAAIAGTNYQIVVDGFDGDCGSIVLQIIAGSPQLGAVKVLPGGGLRIGIEGELGRSYVVESSSDLVVWDAVAVVENSDGILQFVDRKARTSNQRFYRVVFEP